MNDSKITLTHLNEAGHASMVDIGAKPETGRLASASARIRMAIETVECDH